MAQPQVVEHPAFSLIGVEVRTTNAAETNPKSAKIPGHWKKYHADKVAARIPHLDGTPVVHAVYTSYDAGADGEYSLILGRVVDSLAGIPPGMVGMQIPAARYLKFTAEGPMPAAIAGTWKDIRAHFGAKKMKQKRDFTADLELHDPRRPDRVEIYIAIK